MTDLIGLLRFDLGDRHCAMMILEARRVLRADAVQPRPEWPAGMAGCVWHDGQAIPVVDLRAAPGTGPEARVLVLSAVPRVGVVVDRVPGTVRVDAGTVAPAGAGPGLPEGAVAGVVSLADGPAWLVRGDRLLTAAQRAAVAAARGAG